jgi:hypothetical protein
LTRARLAAAAAIAGAAGTCVVAHADSFTPVRLAITVAPVARLHQPLAVTVRVSADPGVLDTRTAPLRAQVKLAGECGGTYRHTDGVALLDKRLHPQPTTGHAYHGGATGSGRPNSYGVQTVCVWIDEEGDNRTFASDQSVQVNVSRRCTNAAARYDALRRNGRRRPTGRRRRALLAARRAARHACGPGVRL